LLREVDELLAKSATPGVSEIAFLRRSYPAAEVHAALTIAGLQGKARQKFPDLRGCIWAVPEALEQATDSGVARHKAARFAACRPDRILDLCAGIGGDAMALAAVAPTVAVDLSEPRLACLRFNTNGQIETVCADVTVFFRDKQQSDAYFHIDPARRSGGKRSPAYEDMIPGPEFLDMLIRAHAGGAIKLSPAVDFDSLPEGHLEIISHNKSVVQAVLWTGSLARGFPPNTRTATMFTDHKLMISYTAPPEGAAISEIAGGASYPFFLYETDPAFTRARLAFALAQSLRFEPLTDDGGYLADLSYGPRVEHPALTAFEVFSLVPYSEKNAIAELQKHSAAAAPGAVEVKTRGKIPGIDTDRLQILFTKAVPSRLTVLIFRFAGTTLAAIATRHVAS
jgi:hypothetical protein